MRKAVQIGPNLRFVVRDNMKILQQINKIEEDFDNGTRLVTTLQWLDVPLVVEDPETNIVSEPIVSKRKKRA